MIDKIEVEAHHISDTETRVVVYTKTHVFLQVVLVRSIVEGWIETGDLAGRALELMINSHPAAVIVNDLYPLLPGLTHSNPEKIVEVIDFKNKTIDLLKSLGYI